jgi:hypothetical protein
MRVKQRHRIYQGDCKVGVKAPSPSHARDLRLSKEGQREVETPYGPLPRTLGIVDLLRGTAAGSG